MIAISRSVSNTYNIKIIPSNFTFSFFEPKYIILINLTNAKPAVKIARNFILYKVLVINHRLIVECMVLRI